VWENESYEQGWGKRRRRIFLIIHGTCHFKIQAPISKIPLVKIPPFFSKGREKDNRLPFLLALNIKNERIS
jgi:hypothetical protein